MWGDKKKCEEKRAKNRFSGNDRDCEKFNSSPPPIISFSHSPGHRISTLSNIHSIFFILFFCKFIIYLPSAFKFFAYTFLSQIIMQKYKFTLSNKCYVLCVIRRRRRGEEGWMCDIQKNVPIWKENKKKKKIKWLLEDEKWDDEGRKDGEWKECAKNEIKIL